MINDIIYYKILLNLLLYMKILNFYLFEILFIFNNNLNFFK